MFDVASLCKKRKKTKRENTKTHAFSALSKQPGRARYLSDSCLLCWMRCCMNTCQWYRLTCSYRPHFISARYRFDFDGGTFRVSRCVQNKCVVSRFTALRFRAAWCDYTPFAFRVECSVNALRSALSALRFLRCVMRLHAFLVLRCMQSVCMVLTALSALRFLRCVMRLHAFRVSRRMQSECVAIRFNRFPISALRDAAPRLSRWMQYDYLRFAW